MAWRFCLGNEEKVEEWFAFSEAIFHEKSLNKVVDMILTLFLSNHNFSELFDYGFMYGIEIRRILLHVNVKELNKFFIEFVVEKSMCGFQNLSENLSVWLNSLDIFEFFTKLLEENAGTANFQQLARLISPLVKNDF